MFYPGVFDWPDLRRKVVVSERRSRWKSKPGGTDLLKSAFQGTGLGLA
jgi:hypothetical protein